LSALLVGGVSASASPATPAAADSFAGGASGEAKEMPAAEGAPPERGQFSISGLAAGNSAGGEAARPAGASDCRSFAATGRCHLGRRCHRAASHRTAVPERAAVAAVGDTITRPARSKPSPAASALVVRPVGATLVPAAGLVCRSFAKTGSCRFGDGCYRAASHRPAAPAQAAPSGPAGPVNGPHSGPTPGPCAAVDATAARARVAVSPVDPIAGLVCRSFAKTGGCRFGDRCYRAASHGAAAPAQVAPSVSAAPRVVPRTRLERKGGAAARAGTAPSNTASALAARSACRLVATTGLCRYGSRCHHAASHPAVVAGKTPAPGGGDVVAGLAQQEPTYADGTKRPAPPAQVAPVAFAAGSVCRSFAAIGRCRYGGLCHRPAPHVAAALPAGCGGEASVGVDDASSFARAELASDEPCRPLASAGSCRLGSLSRDSRAMATSAWAHKDAAPGAEAAGRAVAWVGDPSPSTAVARAASTAGAPPKRGEQVPVCCDLEKDGVCPRGDMCQFAHGGVAAALMSGAVGPTVRASRPREESSSTPCRALLKGRCPRGARCVWSHVRAGQDAE
jgi:Zinc finger C-x8-C-x5-C-x3-H type (and similar)